MWEEENCLIIRIALDNNLSYKIVVDAPRSYYLEIMEQEGVKKMLEQLFLKNVGPATEMKLDLAPRLNILTGDNGLGKSFLLDIAWWALTRKWPSEVNPKLTSGKKALPARQGKATISFSFIGKAKLEEYESTYSRQDQAWTGRPGRPANPGLVLYAQVDGSFALWDPARNYWRKKGNIDIQDRLPAYVFSPNELWDGLIGEDGKPLCNGLILDWAGWQKENGQPFKRLSSSLETISPSEDEPLKPGKLTRIGLDDARDIPTIKMPYEQEIPVINASAGIKRIIGLVYLLVWAWEEHLKASKLLAMTPTSQIIFLIDEIESHLHPRWQRTIVKSLLDVMKKMTRSANVQIITATHSPLVLASLEPIFDIKKDAWFDLDYEPNNKQSQVILTKREFEMHGEVSNWLTSKAFDLPSGRSIESEKIIQEASALLDKQEISGDEIQAMYKKLIKALSPKDNYLFRWRGICKKRGLLK